MDGREIKFVGWHSNSKHPKAPKINLRVDTVSLPPLFHPATKPNFQTDTLASVDMARAEARVAAKLAQEIDDEDIPF